MDGKFENKPWHDYLGEDLRELLKESFLLIDAVEKWNENFHDYSFVVFPAAKAYEGFLKKLFLDMGFITQEDYYGRHFRIGKALNPQLEEYLREKESIYDRLAQYCGGTELSEKLWNTWKKGRNMVFHWFPEEKNAVSFAEAKNRLLLIIDAIDTSFKECKIKSR